MRLNPKTIQVLGGALIPLLGYFSWNWSLYFIVLFYFLDQLVSEVFFSVKLIETKKKQSGDHSIFKSVVLSFILFIGYIMIVHLTFLNLVSIDFKKEAIKFLTYEELGLQQWMFLIPLLALVGYQQYKMEFILRKVSERFSFKDIAKRHIQINILILSSLAVLYASSFIFVLPDVVYLFIIVIFSSAFGLWSDKIKYLKKAH